MEVIINPIGGLANRLRAVASGIALCNALKLKIKEVIWPVTNDLYCSFQDLFNPISSNIKVLNISKFKDLFFFDQPRKQNLYLAHIFQYGKYSSKIIEPRKDITDYLNRLRNSNEPVLLRSGLVFYDFSPEFYRSLFSPRIELLNEAKRRLSSDSEYIGLHIRRTDNVMSIKSSPDEIFINAINRELEINPNTKFYLATDDESTKQFFEKKYGDAILFSHSKADRTSTDGIKEAMIELLCLSLCKKIYGSYWSSFSEAASMLGNTPLYQPIENEWKRFICQ